MNKDLNALRAAIDAIDEELLTLLSRRASIACEVGEVKQSMELPVFRPEREAAVIQRLQSLNQGPLRNGAISYIWREVMSACRALEAVHRVAYLGPAGTFSEQAALEYFGSSIDALSCDSLDEVFRATVAGAADFGVVPVENSTEGGVARSLDLLLQSPVHMVGNISLLVRHNLLRSLNQLEGIEVVLAHPQALAQCHHWLAQHVPHAEKRAVASNAQGARLAASEPKWAAIASERAGSEFGLYAVSKAIQDEAFNRTRFAVICSPSTVAMPMATGNDCTSLVVSVPNRPGAVHDLLAPLKAHGVSMTRWESRPARSGQWEYFFYIDLQGHPSQAHVAAALAQLQGLCSFYKILGAYPASE